MKEFRKSNKIAKKNQLLMMGLQLSQGFWPENIIINELQAKAGAWLR